MAEKELWKMIKEAYNGPGKLMRIEAKSVSGVPDVLGCEDGKAIFIELKHIREPWAEAMIKKVPYDLIGSQAVNLFKWKKAGALSYLIVAFGPNLEIIYVWDGFQALRLVESQLDIIEGKIELPESCNVCIKENLQHLLYDLFN